MKIIGLIFIIVGIVLGYVFLFLDTTNGTGFNNIGLLFHQIEFVIISCVFVLSGIALFCTSAIINELKHYTEGTTPPKTRSSGTSSIEEKFKKFGSKLNDYQIK